VGPVLTILCLLLIHGRGRGRRDALGLQVGDSHQCRAVRGQAARKNFVQAGLLEHGLDHQDERAQGRDSGDLRVKRGAQGVWVRGGWDGPQPQNPKTQLFAWAFSDRPTPPGRCALAL